MEEFRAARAQEPQATLQLLDEATRDVHSAASAAMKLVTLARQALGLDQLPRP